jgi:hypothetical protein
MMPPSNESCLMIYEDAVVRRNPDVVTRKVGDETVLVSVSSQDQAGSCVYYSNRAGTSIWELMDGCRTAEEIAKSVSADYAVAEATVMADVLELLETFLDEGLATIVTEE